MRKNIKLDIAINYVCFWYIFVVSTLKQALKEYETYNFSILQAYHKICFQKKETGLWVVGLYRSQWRIYIE